MSVSRPVVVIQSGDAFENRMRVLPLAIAAQAIGWDPVILVDDAGAASPFLFHGLAAAALKGVGAPGYVPSFTVDTHDLTELAARRAALNGESLSQAGIEKALARSLPLWRLLDRIEPSALFVWNGHTGVWANALRLYKAAKGLPGGFMERGPAPGTLFVDAAGVNGYAAFARERPEAEAAVDLPAELAALAEAPLDRTVPRERTIFVPLQVHDDSSIVLHGGRVRTMGDVVAFALAVAEALGPEWRVTARPHPEEAEGHRPDLPRNRRLSVDAATPMAELIERASYCLTANSTAGLQAALMGRPVICLGEGVYCRQDFVTAAQELSPSEAAAAVATRDGAATAEAAVRFLRALAARHLFWPDQEAALGAAKLERCGLNRMAEPGEMRAIDGVLRRNTRYEAMLKRLAVQQAPIPLDFDFGQTDSLFQTYRLNKAPLSREHLVSSAQAVLGREVALSPAHRKLSSGGRLLIAYSRRRPRGVGRYDAVLDEFGYPHVRTHLFGPFDWLG